MFKNASDEEIRKGKLDNVTVYKTKINDGMNRMVNFLVENGYEFPKRSQPKIIARINQIICEKFEENDNLKKQISMSSSPLLNSNEELNLAKRNLELYFGYLEQYAISETEYENKLTTLKKELEVYKEKFAFVENDNSKLMAELIELRDYKNNIIKLSI